MMKKSDIEIGANRKKKKSAGLTIFDALNTPGEEATRVPVAVQPKGFHSNAARWNEVLTPKTFVVKKKRKKKLSIFKKKILLERLRVHIAAKMTNLARGEPGVSGGPTSQTIHIYNFVDDIDLSDEFEVRETVSELRSLLQPIGLIAEIRVMLSTSDHAGISALASVTFCDESSAANAIGVICGLVCGGRTLIASHGDIAALSDNQSSTATNTSAPTALKAMAYDAHPDVAVYLHKLISSDTLDDADEVHEVIGEVKGLCQVFGGVNSVWIESREEEVLLCQERAQDSADGATASLLPWGIVVYSDIGAGMCAVQLLDGRAVAGSYLSAALLDWDAFERNEFMDSELIDISEKKTDSDVRYSIRLCGFATEEEVASEEERAEVTDNVVSIFLEVGQQVSRDDVIISRSIRSERAGEPSSAVVDIIVVLPSLQMCCDLRKRIGTIVIGGVVAQVDIVQLPDGAPASEQQDQQQQVIRARRCLCSRTGAAVVVVRNFFVEEDLLGDNEELAVMKRDLLDLATDTAESTTAANGRGASSVDQGYVQRIYIYSQGDHSEELATYSETLYAEHGGGEEQEGREQHEKEEEEGGNECAASYVVGITFADPFAAQEALLHLDQRIVAGISLKAQIEPYQATAVVSAITSTRHVVAQEYFGSTEIAETASAEGVIRCLEGIDKSEGDFVCIYSELFASASTTAVTEEGGAEHVTTGGTVGKGAGGTPSKFGEAVALPKLSPHDAPRLSIPMADEATNAAAKELLKLISTFQLRMKEKNPLKVKQKLRFVCGLKQCINAVKGGKVRLLLLAPNTEANEAMDEKIDLLISETQAREVPVCYCLSKRILGKAVQLSMKQSAIAVLDPDGAYEYFKIIMKFLNPDP